LFCGYNPNRKIFNKEVELIHDLEPIEVAEAEVVKLKYEHSGTKDARVFVPKAFKFSRTVAGQILIG
jgi:fatty acid synthase subunit alpha, fungi type